MKKILIISDVSLSEKYVAGNKNALLSLIDYFYLQSDINVELLNFHHNKPSKILGDKCKIHHFPDFFSLAERKILSYLDKSKKLIEYKKSFFRSIVTQYITSEVDYDYVIFEYMENHHLVNDIKSPSSKLVCDIHDVMSLRRESFFSQGKLPKRENLDINLDEELAVLKKFDAIIAIEESESELLKLNLPDKAVLLCKRTLFQDVDISRRKIKKYNEIVVGFIGSLAEFNQDVFFNDILPIWNNHLSKLGMKLVIAGAISDIIKSKNILIEGNVDIIGKIDSLSDYYNLIDVALNPIWAGSGFKTKNAEALSFGKPVITTNLGAMGFEDISPVYLVKIEDSSSESWMQALDFILSNYKNDENYNTRCLEDFNRVFGIDKNYQSLKEFIS